MTNAEAEKTPCEVCGQPSKWILARRLNGTVPPEKGLNFTVVNSDAPLHPRCGAHVGADAYALDGRVFDHTRPV